MAANSSINPSIPENHRHQPASSGVIQKKSGVMTRAEEDGSCMLPASNGMGSAPQTSNHCSDTPTTAVVTSPSPHEERARNERERAPILMNGPPDSAANDSEADTAPVVKIKSFSQGRRDLKFDTSRVEKMAEDILVTRLKDVPYEPTRCKRLSQQLAAIIMDNMKTLRIKNYKFVAVVSIGSLKERPGMQFGTRCLWNEERDSFASVKFTNGSLFALAMVYGVYFE